MIPSLSPVIHRPFGQPGTFPTHVVAAMYRTNNFEWKLTHVLCILAHLGLIVAAGVVYVFNMARQSTRMADLCSGVNLSETTSIACALTLTSGFGAWGSMDLLLHTLLVSCVAVVSLEFLFLSYRWSRSISRLPGGTRTWLEANDQGANSGLACRESWAS